MVIKNNAIKIVLEEEKSTDEQIIRWKVHFSGSMFQLVGNWTVEFINSKTTQSMPSLMRSFSSVT